MNRTTLLVAGTVAAVAAIAMFVSDDPRIASAGAPSWLPKVLLGGGGLITFLLGLFQKKDPKPGPVDPNVKVDIVTIIKALTDGDITPADLLLLREFFKGGSDKIILGPDGKPITIPPIDSKIEDIDKLKIIIGQVISLVATSKEFKDKGLPSYIHADVAWDATTFTQITLGIDPRPPATKVPSISPSV